MKCILCVCLLLLCSTSMGQNNSIIGDWYIDGKLKDILKQDTLMLAPDGDVAASLSQPPCAEYCQLFLLEEGVRIEQHYYNCDNGNKHRRKNYVMKLTYNGATRVLGEGTPDFHYKAMEMHPNKNLPRRLLLVKQHH